MSEKKAKQERKEDEKKIETRICDFCGKERIAGQVIYSNKNGKTANICYMCIMGCVNNIYKAVAQGIDEAEKIHGIRKENDGDNKETEGKTA